MRIDRSFLGWGVFFLLVGAIPLAVRGGYLTSAQVADLWRFWPLFLVVGGLSILLRKTPLDGLGGVLTAGLFGVLVGAISTSGFGGFPGSACGGAQGGTGFPTREGVLASSAAEVEIDLDCGELEVTMTGGAAWSVSGVDRDGTGPEVSGDASSLRIRSGEGGRGPFGWLNDRDSWRVVIPTDPTIDLGVEVNAGKAAIHLAGARLGVARVEVNAGSVTLDMRTSVDLRELDIQANAGSLDVALPAATFRGRIEVNAGSVGLCVPPGIGLRIETANNPIASYDFNGHGLIHDGSLWITPGFDAATVRIELDVEANAGTIELDPKEGCGG